MIILKKPTKAHAYAQEKLGKNKRDLNQSGEIFSLFFLKEKFHTRKQNLLLSLPGPSCGG